MTRILLADDHAMLREGLKSLLVERDDFEVVGEASDGLEAIEKAEQLTPDLAILDISLPRMDGIQVIRRLLELSEPPDIIILSMHTERHYIREALRAGARGYVLKEAAARDLQLAVDIVRQGNVYLTPSIASIMAEDLVGERTGQALSNREVEVLCEIASGKSTQEIAQILNLSPKTVETHRRNLMEKLEIRSVAELTRYAIRNGLVSL